MSLQVASNRSIRGDKVLVIDDDPILCELVQSVLAGWGHTVLAAGDAAAGLRLLFAARPDLVILDLNLPDQELRARVEALLRRARRRGEELRLTPLEFRLLSSFVRHAGQVLSADQLIEMAWRDPLVRPEQVKLYVGRLRRKLGDAEAIETVRGLRLPLPGARLRLSGGVNRGASRP